MSITTNPELQAKMAERQEEIQAKIKEIRLANELRKLDSPLYERRQLEKQDSLRLDSYIEAIEEMYSVDNRRLSRVFGYSVLVDKMLTIIRSVQYSKLEEKQELLMLTGLDEQTIEDVLDALGNTAYFSVREMRLIDEIPADIATLRELLVIVALDMGLVSTLNLSKVSKSNFDYQFTRARLRAEEALDNTVKYTEESVAYAE